MPPPLLRMASCPMGLAPASFSNHLLNPPPSPSTNGLFYFALLLLPMALASSSSFFCNATPFLPPSPNVFLPLPPRKNTGLPLQSGIIQEMPHLPLIPPPATPSYHPAICSDTLKTCWSLRLSHWDTALVAEPILCRYNVGGTNVPS